MKPKYLVLRGPPGPKPGPQASRSREDSHGCKKLHVHLEFCLLTSKLPAQLVKVTKILASAIFSPRKSQTTV